MSDVKNFHFFMFPWLAFGHMIPYLELAKLLAKKGHKISFFSTPKNIQRLPKLPPNLKPKIEFITLQLPHVENLPENAEATIDLPYNKVRYLKIAFDKLQESMPKLIETLSPDFVIQDFASYWLVPITKKSQTPTIYFSIFPATGLSMGGDPSSIIIGDDDRVKPEDFTVKPKWVPFETNVRPSFYQIQRMFNDLVIDGGNVSDIYRLAVTVKGVDVVAIRSCYEFEGEWLQVIENLYEKEIIPIGLLPTTSYDDGEDDNNETWLEMKAWLDMQQKGSVVYIAFGSETKPSQDELTIIALGLELSNLPFFWVFRQQRGCADSEVIELPEQFEERTNGRGFICTSWAPQLKILNHESIGGFLTHSGWSSVIEAVQFEKPLILLPFLADQGMICSHLTEKKLGYPIFRNELDGSFTKECVAESLRLVIVEEKGKIYRQNVKEMKESCSKDVQQRFVDNLLDYLQSHKRFQRRESN
ncbi:UDP-glycosyltransferase 91A1-like [Nicotiana sylvestris]|uniref:Glycosyltransferase n=1 Tax=Nicotiana sylvestris TaxID=4096 RepID=A0A1U7Y8S9_NICSY|nr:PREDICTED: UDP-glycosyltransferase 91A1-like [Nicotiana sylvestris]XP_016444344.1 PREDICTED: UDP-glycosyltransferase 91A1-like [Nicotiana tabacum]